LDKAINQISSATKRSLWKLKLSKKSHLNTQSPGLQLFESNRPEVGIADKFRVLSKSKDRKDYTLKPLFGYFVIFVVKKEKG